MLWCYVHGSELSASRLSSDRSHPHLHLDSPLTPSLVLNTLQPLSKTEPTRACYRLIGGVLVQRNVKDVVPALETNYTGIKEVLETLVKNYKAKEEEFGAFQREYKIGVSIAAVECRGKCCATLLELLACCSSRS